jgi:hypothetical protein
LESIPWAHILLLNNKECVSGVLSQVSKNMNYMAHVMVKLENGMLRMMEIVGWMSRLRSVQYMKTS